MTIAPDTRNCARRRRVWVRSCSLRISLTSTVRFAPPSALDTPELIERACSAYTQAIRDGHTDPLLAIAMFILDFTCIHPFNDGNGRMSRLLTLLMLCRNGYMVGKYISIEHLIEQSKSTYYEALAAAPAT